MCVLFGVFCDDLHRAAASRYLPDDTTKVQKNTHIFGVLK